MYYKLGQACVTNWGSFVLLEIRANIVTNWDSFIFTNWSKYYYKLGQLSKIRAIITNWGITHIVQINNDSNIGFFVEPLLGSSIAL